MGSPQMIQIYADTVDVNQLPAALLFTLEKPTNLPSIAFDLSPFPQ